MRALTSLLSISLAVAACGGDDGGKVTLVDASPVGGNIDAPAQVDCLLPSSLGSVTPSTQEGHFAMSMGETTPDNYYLYADLNADASPDVLLIDLYKGFGAFMAGFPTGPQAVTLTGAEASYDSCGACIMALTDYTMAGPTGDPYFATGGTLNLTSVSNTSIAGTLSNVTLVHSVIDMDTNVTTPHPDGCSSTLGSISFSATPTAQTFAPGSRPRLKINLRHDRI
ncbi:MAG: hypothetical protein JWP01_3186 [Myxococcales bacterium]|nr:hypothetical protein [Myxococcales bacterium]